jgi:GT2 family glycosyltransferase
VTQRPATRRPTVSVIVPFAGSEAELERLLIALSRLQLMAGDEVIVADNRAAGGRSVARGLVQLYPAGGLRSPGFARNRGAGIAHGQWMVFLDADTEPSASLLENYFAPPPDPSTGILAGEIVDITARPTPSARHGAVRSQMSQRTTLAHPYGPYAQTANCAVLRSAFDAVGGFDDRARAGEDADLCFRLAREGWRLEPRPRATVSRRSRETVSALLAQLARHGSGAAWLNKRYPGSFPRPRVTELVRGILGSARAALLALTRGDRQTTAKALLDLAEASAFELGRLLPNRARARASRAQRRAERRPA